MPFADEVVTRLADSHIRVKAMADGNCLLNSFYLNLAATFAEHDQFRGFNAKQVNTLLTSVCANYPELQRISDSPSADAYVERSENEELIAENHRLYRAFLRYFDDWDSRQYAMATVLRQQIAENIDLMLALAPAGSIDEQTASELATTATDYAFLGHHGMVALSELYRVGISYTSSISSDSDTVKFHAVVSKNTPKQHTVHLLATEPSSQSGHYDLLLPTASYPHAGAFATQVHTAPPDATHSRANDDTSTLAIRHDAFPEQMTWLYNHGRALSQQLATHTSELGDSSHAPRSPRYSENARVHEEVTNLLQMFDQGKKITKAHFTSTQAANDFALALQLQIEELEQDLRQPVSASRSPKV